MNDQKVIEAEIETAYDMNKWCMKVLAAFAQWQTLIGRHRSTTRAIGMSSGPALSLVVGRTSFTHQGHWFFNVGECAPLLIFKIQGTLSSKSDKLCFVL